MKSLEQRAKELGMQETTCPRCGILHLMTFDESIEQSIQRCEKAAHLMLNLSTDTGVKYGKV